MSESSRPTATEQREALLRAGSAAAEVYRRAGAQVEEAARLLNASLREAAERRAAR